MSEVTPPKPAPSPITWGPVTAVVVTVVIFFLSQFIAAFVIYGIAKGKGWNHTELTAWTEQVGPQFLYVALVESTVLGMLWFYLRQRKATFKTLGLRRPTGRDLGWSLTGFVIYFPLLIGVMAGVRVWLPQINTSQKQQIGFQGAHGPALWLVFVSLVILPPLAEEILTRGFLYSGLKTKLPTVAAAIITSVVFASAHLQFGSGSPLLWTAAIDTFLLSLVLVYVRQKSGGLWGPIGLHMLKNTLAFVTLFIFIT